MTNDKFQMSNQCQNPNDKMFQAVIARSRSDEAISGLMINKH